MKSAKSQSPLPRAPQVRPRGPAAAASRAPGTRRVFRTQVAVGDVISFDPTGEELRVTRIEGGRITFEKQP